MNFPDDPNGADGSFGLALSTENMVLLPAGGKIILAYHLAIPDNAPLNNPFTFGKSIVSASYGGTVENLKSGTVHFTDTIKYKNVAPLVFHGLADLTWNETSVTKFDGKSCHVIKDISSAFSTLREDLEAFELDYYAAVANHAADVQYSFDDTVTYIIDNPIPEGMELADTDVKLYYLDNYYEQSIYDSNDAWVNYNGDPDVIENDDLQEKDSSNVGIIYNADNTVSFRISNTPLPAEETGPALVVFYKLKFTENKITELINAASNGEVISLKFENDASVILCEEFIAPGVEKTARTENNIVMPNDNWGVGIEWTVSVYNGDGSAENIAEHTALADLTDYTISDTMPANNRYYGSAVGDVSVGESADYTGLMGATYIIYDLIRNADGSATRIASGISGTIVPTVDGAAVTDPADTDGKAIVFTATDDMKLAANQCIDVTFCTSNAVDNGTDGYVPAIGTVSNTAVVTFTQNFSENQVAAGTVRGDKIISDTATHWMGGINTEA